MNVITQHNNFALIYSPLRSPRGQLCHEKGFHLCITFEFFNPFTTSPLLLKADSQEITSCQLPCCRFSVSDQTTHLQYVALLFPVTCHLSLSLSLCPNEKMREGPI